MAERCTRYTAYGSRCELDDGHDGRHQLTLASGNLFTWTDESQTRLMEGGLGT